MPFSYRDLICGGKTFCCCLPVRLGVISMSILGMLVAGILSIGLWFEVSANTYLSKGERIAFIVTALMETILFAASILGFVGTVVRKQSFIQTYAYILYGHFLCNVAAAAYLLYSIISFQKNITELACESTVSDPGAQDQCRGLLRITTKIYIAIAALVLFIELYGAIIVTRHLNLVKQEKRSNKEFRENVDSAFRLQKRSHAYTPVSRSDLERGSQDQEFNPYVEAHGLGHSRNASDLARQRSVAIDPNAPAVPVEVGYGGGSWTHSDISEEEKTRLQRAGSSSAASHEPQVSDEERNRRRSEHKLISPPDIVPVEPLPEYTPPPRH
ncbi:hypothetical protein BKA70DRAFT_1147394 [Coprinopsis sp. MPI-PUGE-AT-0042]|nr:hypothetical protein BKA70DRAFT_1147394 [Coprinopsis sp. MPI-PUGE-AT-0042]